MKPRALRRVVILMWRAALVLAIAGCGGKSPPVESSTSPGSAEEYPGVVRDTRTEIERRRDAACEQLGPKLTECAVSDARAAHAAGTISRQELDANISREVQRKHTDEFIKECTARPLSSRQVRVLEVCHHEEPECAPLIDCLAHLNAPASP
jgi:hypothetical protein